MGQKISEGINDENEKQGRSKGEQGVKVVVAGPGLRYAVENERSLAQVSHIKEETRRPYIQ